MNTQSWRAGVQIILLPLVRTWQWGWVGRTVSELTQVPSAVAGIVRVDGQGVGAHVKFGIVPHVQRLTCLGDVIYSDPGLG